MQVISKQIFTFLLALSTFCDVQLLASKRSSFPIFRCRRRNPLRCSFESWRITGFRHQLSFFDVYIEGLHHFHRRMREMFKPSMAELGLCMYQVEKYHQISSKHPNIIKTSKYHQNIQISSSLASSWTPWSKSTFLTFTSISNLK